MYLTRWDPDAARKEEVSESAVRLLKSIDGTLGLLRFAEHCVSGTGYAMGGGCVTRVIGSQPDA